MDMQINKESGSTNEKPFDDKRQPSIKELQKTVKDYDEHLLMTSTKSTSVRMKAVNDLAEDFRLPKKYQVVSTSIKTKDEVSSTALDYLDQVHNTELGNSERFLWYHNHKVKYCHDLGKWLVWDDKRWLIDDKGKIKELAIDTVKRMLNEMPRKRSKEEKEALGKHALRSESDRQIYAMLHLAESSPNIATVIDEFDKDGWLLNCQNGTVDLRNVMSPRVHNKNDLITKVCNAEYDPNATCERWLEFMNTIMDKDQDVIKYLQKCIGYSLTGDNGEQCFFLLHGSGANGKSTFLSVIKFLLNDYAIQANPALFLAKKIESASAASPEVSRLKGSRFVSALETGEGKAFAENFIKHVTGGEAVSARPLYKETIEFTPTFKIWIGTNHKPVIRGTDHAIWRRVRLIPFEITIPNSQMIPNYAEILKEDAAGILNWAIEGCYLWREEGLIQPEKIKKATLQYKDEMDKIGDFIKDCCEMDRDDSYKDLIAIKDLYDAYAKYCDESKERPLSKIEFGKCVAEKGISRGRGRDARFWVGISLKK